MLCRLDKDTWNNISEKKKRNRIGEDFLRNAIIYEVEQNASESLVQHVLLHGKMAFSIFPATDFLLHSFVVQRINNPFPSMPSTNETHTHTRVQKRQRTSMKWKQNSIGISSFLAFSVRLVYSTRVIRYSTSTIYNIQWFQFNRKKFNVRRTRNTITNAF